MRAAAKIKWLSALALSLVFAGQSETIYWADDFETDAGIRWTTNSVWQIGSPNGGPATNAAGFRTHSFSKCASTGLQTTAPANVDKRLICTNYNGATYLTVPSANQSPRLRFWQWYNFVNTAGLVEIRLESSTNWLGISLTNVSSGATVITGGGIWTRSAIDLTAYAGMNVQIAFRFAAGSGSFGSSRGWSVDDVSVVTGALTFNDPEGFEAGLGDWFTESGTWEVGVPTFGPATNAAGSRAHTGTNCVGTVLAGNYAWNAATRFISPPFTVPASNRPALKFAEWYQFINAGGVVEVSSVSVLTNLNYTTNFLFATNVNRNTNIIQMTNFFFGYSQTNLAVFTNLNVNTNIYSVTNFGATSRQTNVLTFTNVNRGTNIIIVTNNLGFDYTQTNVYVFTNLNGLIAGINVTASQSTNNWQAISRTNLSSDGAVVASGGWKNTGLDLSAYVGQTLRASFRFESGGSGFGNAAGWYVDDLLLVTAPLLTAPAGTNISVGQIFSAAAFATNTSGSNTNFTFALASVSTNGFITTNGVFNWTNTRPALGTNIVFITTAADGVPPVTTNSFTVIVTPPGYNFSGSNTLAAKKYFLLALQSLSNTTWRIDAATNLAGATNWRPVFTSAVPSGGLLLYTDRLATNFPIRFYRAVYP